MTNGADIRRQLMADLNRDYLAYLAPMGTREDNHHGSISEQSPQSNSTPLTSNERDILVAGGARFENVHGTHTAEIAQGHRQQLQNEIGAMIREAMTLEEASQWLSLPEDVIRGLVNKESPEFFAFEAPDGTLLLPGWQFTNQGALPHLSEILNRISPELSALTINRFMTRKHPDLELPAGIVSPLDWLATGQDPNEVLVLASDL